MNCRSLFSRIPLGLLLLGGLVGSIARAAEGPPVITTQPASITVLQGTAANFSVVVDGTVPFTYQWRRNGAPISGATSSSYSIPVTTAADNTAVFSVLVTNAVGNTASADATLRVDPGALITSTTNVIPISTQNWRYYTNGGELGTAWKEVGYVENGLWFQGQALFGVEVAGLYPEPIRTPFTAYTQSITTYWFRTHFTFSPTGGNVAGISLALSANVDDGGVFYLNGAEFFRVRVPAGQTAATFATGDNEGGTETFSFTPTNLVAGDNVLAVEVHQQSAASSDIVFGMSLAATVTNRVPDTTAPVVTTINPLPGITVLLLNTIEVFFNEEVQGLDASDLRINTQPATNVVHEGPGQYVFTFTQPATGAVQVAWAAGHGITDLAPTPNAFAGGSWMYTLDPNSTVQDVRISEFMADNQNGIRDEDGDRSDWVEIYNASPTSVNLGGWFLTDNSGDPTKFRIPNGTLMNPNSYLLFWASEKPGRTNPALPMHLNFKLDPSGEYLALFNPSTNVVSAFTPFYMQQRPDVSYGRDRLDPNSIGFYSTPTPGAANGTSGGNDFAPDIVLSRQSGTFSSPFTLSLTTPSPNAVIRIVVITNLAAAVGNSVLTNNATTNSPIYSGPMPIYHTTQIRARAFEPGKLPGTPVTASYIALSPNVLGWSSDLPVVILHALSAGTISGAGDQAGVFMTFDNDCGRVSLTNVPSLHSRMGINTRGASTGGQPKSNFAVETWDEFNQDTDREVLGMPAESDWVFYGINGFDPGLMHNAIFHWLGRQTGLAASRTRYVEVFRKLDSGPVTTNDYFGLYLLEEKPKRNNNRLDINALQPEDTNAVAITGGYMLRIDRTDANERFWSVPTIGSIRPTPASIILDYPNNTLGTADPRILSQVNWIQTHILNFLTNLSLPSYTNEFTGYNQYINADQWIDNLIANIIPFNVDGYRLSGYFYKDRSKRFEQGPLWDCDRCLGTGGNNDPVNDDRCYSPRFWRLPAFNVTTDNGTDFFGLSNVGVSWFTPLFQDPEFWQKFIDRYQALRTNEYSTNAILGAIDQFHNEIREAQVREQLRWGGMWAGVQQSFNFPRSGPNTVQNYTFDFGPANNAGRGAFAKEVEFQKRWLLDRLEFLDTNFLAKPVLSAGTGPVNVGATVTVTPAAKPGTLLLYTLNGTDPRARGGSVAPGVMTNNGPLVVTISSNVRLVARSYNPTHANQTNAPGGEVGKPLINSFWSGPAAATYYTTIPPLRITEIMYHPADPPQGNTNDQDLFEYIEVKNISGAPLDITGYRIRGGVDFDFPSLVLTGSQQVVVVRDVAAFQSRYGTGPVIAGAYTNDNLANDGDNLRLEGRLHEPILDFNYDDRWYPSTDGAGFALQIVNDSIATTNWGLKTSWRPSGAFQGTPGTGDPGAPAIPVIYINEALTHTLPPDVDAIELYNPSGSPVNVGGWFLTDDFGNPKKYRLPNPTTVPGNGYLALYADTSFGSALLLSSRGDELYLFSGDANTNLTGYVHGFDFGPQTTNATFGRYVISSGEDHFPTQKFPTLGGPNPGPKVGPIVISEINYHPPELVTVEGPRDNQKDEFIELENISESSQPLYDPANPANTCQLRDAISFTFPTGLVMQPRGQPGDHVIIVAFDPVLDPAAADAFRARNGALQGAPLLGPYSGKLDNSSDSVELVRPLVPLTAGPPDELLVDKVRYSDLPPWPTNADGLGFSLQRLVTSDYGNDVTNWVADFTTPGSGYGPGNGPVITLQPQNIAVLGTLPAQFSVTATGAQPIYYQWYFGLIGISGATNSIYIIPSVQSGQAGQYRCLVQNAGGRTYSSIATLTYITPPSITLHPTNVFLRVPPDTATQPARTANFRIAATTITPPLSYRWRFNGTNIPLGTPDMFGITSSNLVVTNVVFGHAGLYSCAVTDGNGTLYTTEAVLGVSPFLLSSSQPLTVAAGADINVSAVVQASPGPFQYSWRRGTPINTNIVSNSGTNYATWNSTAAGYVLINNILSSNYQLRLVFTNLATGPNGLALINNNNFITVVADTDGDGIPNTVEVGLGLDPMLAADGDGDLDGDGMSNADEYRAGTNPTDPASYLRVDLSTVPGQATVRFGAVSNHTYTVQYTDSLPALSWNRLADVLALSSNRVETFVDPTWNAKRFYQVTTPRAQ